MRQYEMTYLVSDKVNDSDLTAATGKINGIITSHKGKILGEDNWGRRKLAYPIGKQEFATYVTLNFELDPSQLVSVNRDLRLSHEVLRHLVVVKDFGKEELKLTADEIAETEEIEEVVGGEKSFEAIEGETEESYDLMAKRADEEKDNAEEEIEEEVGEEAKAKEEIAEKVENKKDEETTETKKEVNEEKITKPVKEDKKPTTKKSPAKKTKKDDDTEKVVKIKDEEEKAKKKKEEEKAEQEADRLAKLDEEIEGILGDDL